MTDAHGHDPHAPIEDEDRPPSDHELLEQAIRELLVEKGVISAQEITRQIETMDSKSPVTGSRLIARAWTDPAFKQRFLEEPASVLTEIGISLEKAPEVMVLENTPEVHNVVVCTLCSCYPRMVLGMPPAWYKKKAYRARVVKEPRAVLAEFGTVLPDDVELRVHDSTADLRYIVMPMRPAGTEGWDEDRLAALVTRDAMIGVCDALPANAAPAVNPVAA